MKAILASLTTALLCATALARDTAIYNGKLTNALNANGFAITNVPAPTASGDVANKAYVDSAGGVMLSTVTNIASSASITNGGAKAYADANFVSSSTLREYAPLTKDVYQNYTAFTVGTRNGDYRTVGSRSYAQGNQCIAQGNYSFAAGDRAKAYGAYSHAEGAQTSVTGECTYAWSGNPNGYRPLGTRTFNVNPVGGISGFFIGYTDLGTHMTNVVNSIADYAVTTSVTNAVATAMDDLLGSNWKTTYGGGLAGVLAAIFAAIAVLWAKKLSDNTADYDASSTYAVGAFVKKDGKLYVCNTAITTAEAWTAAHWTAMPNVFSLFSGTNTLLTATIKSVTEHSVKLSVTAVTLDGVTVTGQTVYVHAGTSASDPILYSKPYNGTPITFEVTTGMQYFVRITNGISGHFPSTATGYASADTSITLVYSDVSSVNKISQIAECLESIGDVTAAKALLVGKVFDDVWIDYDATATGDAYTLSHNSPRTTVSEIYDSNTDSDGHPIWYDPWVLTDVQNVEDANGTSHIGAVMMRKYCGRYTIVFDAANTEEATEATAQSGVYYYGLESGQTSPTAAKLTLLSLAVGDDVPYDSYAKVYKNTYRDTTKNIVQYGHNRYETSAIRQYLNSAANKDAWWTQQHVGQKKPSSASNYSGYKRGCSSGILAALKPVKHTIFSNTVCDGGAAYTVCDDFFLPCCKEMYGVGNNVNEGENQAKYWKGLLDDESANPADSNAALNAVRKMLTVHTKSSAASVWLRSAVRGYSCYVWYVSSGGNLGSSSVYNAYAPVPACVIY